MNYPPLRTRLALIVISLIHLNGCIEMTQRSLESSKKVDEKLIQQTCSVEIYPSAEVRGEEVVTITAHPESSQISYDKYRVTTTTYKANWWPVLGLVAGIVILTQATTDSAKGDAMYWLLLGGSAYAVINAIVKDGKSESQQTYIGKENHTEETKYAEGRSAFLEFTYRGSKHLLFLGVFDTNRRIQFSLSDFYRKSSFPFKNKEEFRYYLKGEGGGFINVDWGTRGR